jgi:heme A synthase
VNVLYHAHSGLRYLVLLAALVAVISLGYSLVTARGLRIAFASATTFTGLLDLQILLGVGLVIGGLFPDAVAGHLALMVFAAVAAHATSIIGRRSSNDRRELAIRLVGVTLAAALIIGGILAIGRSVLGSVPAATGAFP